MRTYSSSPTVTLTISCPITRRTSTKSLIDHANFSPSTSASSAASSRRDQEPDSNLSSASVVSPARTALNAPRLPHAMPSTGVPCSAAARSAVSTVPSPPIATTRSHASTSPSGATIRIAPRARTCTTSTSRSSAHCFSVESGNPISRLGWRTRPMRFTRAAYALARQRLRQLAEHLDVVVDRPIGVRDRERPLLLASRRHEDAAVRVEEPGELGQLLVLVLLELLVVVQPDGREGDAALCADPDRVGLESGRVDHRLAAAHDAVVQRVEQRVRLRRHHLEQVR